MEQTQEKVRKSEKWFNKNYKILMLLPIILTVLSLIYLFNFYSANNDLILKDTSLSGGTILTLYGNLDFSNLESALKQEYTDISFRRLTNSQTGDITAFIIESSSQPEEIKASVEKILGAELKSEDYSLEFTGSNLSNSFYNQLIKAFLIAFILMSVVVFILFRSFIPSIAVIFAAFSDIVMAIAAVDLLGIKMSAAGIAAFLMLVGYSVDKDILLTTRALKKKEGALNQRIFGAFKVGIFMTLTALIAIIPAFILIKDLPDSFRQIFLVLGIGLVADIFNTWLTNVGIIKWYCERKGRK